MSSQYRTISLSTRKPSSICAYPAQRPTCRVFDGARLSRMFGFRLWLSSWGRMARARRPLLRALVDRYCVLPRCPDLSTAEAPISTCSPFLIETRTQNEPTRFRVEFDADWLAVGRRLGSYSAMNSPWGVLALGRHPISSSVRHCFTFQKAGQTSTLRTRCAWESHLRLSRSSG